MMGAETPRRTSESRLYVRWDDDLRDAFAELGRREGFSRGARMLDMTERNLFDYRKGLSRAGHVGGRTRPRRFLSLSVLERLASALDDPMLENREALTHREWCDRGEWAWGPTDARAEDGRFAPRGGDAA